ncbi:hypothetical protein GALL_431020 [mine drainage metagenome]|uniref:Uncharacterized protein n=1 Tax=mine drainage metagenome TaxID=410659 RepID=A0A1J5QCL8_9ZZZZ
MLGLVEQGLGQLLARAQAGDLDLDVLARRAAGQGDHLARQIHDPDRLAHLQQEQPGVMAVGALGAGGGGVQDQLGGLGDGHEIARHLLVGDRHRAATIDLRLEDRHDRPGGAKHIAEPHGREAGALAGLLGLDDRFREPLGGAHDIGGIDGLVRGDQHHLGGAAGAESEGELMVARHDSRRRSGKNRSPVTRCDQA